MADTAARKPVPLVPLLVAGAFFMEMLDSTVIVTALPAMARSFHVAAVDLDIGITAYILTLAVMIPVSGWIAERHGARNVFAAAMLIFTAASVLCATTDAVWSFTAARVLQGFGGALMVPVGRLIVLRTTAKQDLLRATATLTWPALVAPVIGPPLGGFITTVASWRWIFYLNLPLGLIGIACAWVLIGNARAAERRRLDWTGFLLMGGTCVALIYGFSLIGQSRGDVRLAGLLVAAGLTLGWAAFAHARRHAGSLLDVATLRVRTYGVSIGGGSLIRMAISAAPFLLPLLFQLAFGMTPFASGLLLLALFAGNLGIKPATTPLLRHFGFRAILLVNGLVLAASFVAIAGFSRSTPVPLMAAVLVVSGMARSMQFTALGSIAFADMPPERMTAANTFFSLVMQLSVGLGVALGAALLRAAAWFGGGEPGPHLADFRAAFIVVALLVLLGLLDCRGLPADAGAEVSRHRRYLKTG